VINMHRLITLALIVASIACARELPPEEPCGFMRNSIGRRISWNDNLPVNLYLHKSIPAEAEDAIYRAINEYNVKLNREMFRVNAWSDKDWGMNGYNVIYWNEVWQDDDYIEGMTTSYWSGGQFVEADIKINAMNFAYHVEENENVLDVDLTSLMVHELGHVLGLAHNESYGSVMYHSLFEGEVRRTLSDEDIANLRCEY
jgi:predicted Zn-dependent protease